MKLPLLVFTMPNGDETLAYLLGFTNERAVIAWNDSREIMAYTIAMFGELFTLDRTMDTVVATERPPAKITTGPC